MLFVFNYTY